MSKKTKEPVKIEAVQLTQEIRCNVCGRDTKEAMILHLPCSFMGPGGRGYMPVILCYDCVKDLREQIDALRVLVLTGKDTINNGAL